MKQFPSLISLLLLCLLFQSSTLIAANWQTSQSGYWNNPATWVGGQVPPLTLTDTMTISHAVAISGDLEVRQGFLMIDSAGGICGHQSLTLDSSAVVLNYGVLEFDFLIVRSGVMYCMASSKTILTASAQLEVGAYLEIMGLMVLGQWFDCEMPLFEFTAMETIHEAHIRLFPNPSNGKVIFEWEGMQEMESLTVRDIQGKLVFFSECPSLDTKAEFDLADLPAGYYTWEMQTMEPKRIQGRLMIAH